MEGRLEEVDRGRVAAGNDVRVHVDALPEQTLAAKLAGVSPRPRLVWPTRWSTTPETGTRRASSNSR